MGPLLIQVTVHRNIVCIFSHCLLIVHYSSVSNLTTPMFGSLWFLTSLWWSSMFSGPYLREDLGGLPRTGTAVELKSKVRRS